MCTQSQIQNMSQRTVFNSYSIYSYRKFVKAKIQIINLERLSLSKKQKIKEIQVSEKQLEALLIKDLSVIDPKLRFLGRQIETDSGFLDVLALHEEDNGLALIELKVKEDDGQLFQAVRYYDWVKSRIELIRRSYNKEIDIHVDPWIILVAPSFSENLKKVARYISVDYLSLYEYSVLQLSNGDKWVFCKDIDYGEPYEPREIPTIDGHLNYITNQKVRSICSDALSTLKKSGIEVQPKRGKINLLLGSKIIGKVRCRKQFFKIASVLTGEWSDYHYIYTKKDWRSFFKKEIKPFI